MLAIKANQFYNGSMNEVVHLYKLQTLDHELEKIESRLLEIKSLLESSESLREAELIADAAQKKLNAAQKKLEESEQLSEKQRLKISTDESSLYSGRIHNPKELQDLQQEIALLKKYQVDLEERQLTDMVLLEEAEGEMAAAENLLRKAQTKDIEEKASLRGEQMILDKQKDRLLSEKSAATNSISAEIIEIYLRLRKQKRGTAVSLVVDGSCSSCGSTLRPAERQAARSTQITYCSSCGRIIYAG